MTLRDILTNAERGAHPACSHCVWRPTPTRRVAYGVSCLKHGVNWKADAKAISIQISQDPAGTTPEKTGCLCAVCNSANPTDKSAQQGIALWRAGIERDPDTDRGARFLAAHYWTNAVLHGSGDGQLESARSSCVPVVRDQIVAASPKVIIAGGKVAAESLIQMGLIGWPWGTVRQALRRGAYSENVRLPNGQSATVFVTYHASARSVNQTVSGMYADDVEGLLQERLRQCPTAGEARRFLNRYDRSTTTGKGMRLLLLHWLDIGVALRAAHGAAA